MNKRMTICIDVDENNLEQVAQEVQRLENQLQFTVAEYDPAYNFDVAIDDVKEVN